MKENFDSSSTKINALIGCIANYWSGQNKCYQILDVQNEFSKANSTCSAQDVWYLNDFGSFGKAELVSFRSNDEVLELMDSFKWFFNPGKYLGAL